MLKLDKKEIDEVLELLKTEYGNAGPMLNFTTPFELLIATVLSAQCTDIRVNIVTEKLYKMANTPEGILELGEKKLQDTIKSCGLYKTKGKNILSLCKILIDKHDSQVPMDINELTALPGVGRKTANVVMSNAFGIPAIAVDTHVFRVANRIGLACSKNVLSTEKDLMEAIPKAIWSQAHHWLIFHGRQICSARSPKCVECFLKNYCLYYREG
ncbi:endonuclease III [Alkalibacter saccharofermentans]|uniref:Endonuclease III n=1 Tax=Alkalibacter saccharofermentans DSM 14828 TaxID=1120975 RepID=A0A1M4XDX6_9FIRM|nr:endonuclease III [Alkalibacter saccharofermentans]SHE91591.1 DNA-(apurinic or apyrimidinic site) lyase /endonuclease III [Alkalibacter saccharofermentans DSM 14828]